MRFGQPKNEIQTAVPDGDNACTITSVKERDINGRSVLIVTFTPDDDQFAAFDKFLDPHENRDLIITSKLTAALGLPPDEDLCASTIGGARVIVQTKVGRNPDGSEKVNKSGATVVYVNGISAAPNVGTRPGGPAAKPAARTPAAKVAAARGDEPGGEDDIPF